jgi:hypothetical protein
MSEPFDPPPPPTEPPGFSPPPGGGEAAAGNPWEQRDRLGFVNAFVENVKLFVTNPTEAFERTRRQGDYVGPLIFAIILGWITYLISQLWGMLFGASMILPMMPAEVRDQMGGMMAVSGAQIVFGLVLYPVFAAIGLFIGSGILHLCLMLVGGTEASESGFEGTFRTAAYSSVASLAQIVPVVGGLISLVWWIFLAVIGLSTLHRTTQGKALLAILIPLILCCICVGAVVFFGMAAFFGAVSQQ